MVNDCAKPCKAKNVFARKRNFSLNKAKKEKKNFFVESFDQCRHLEVCEKARKVFVMSLRLSDQKVVTQHHIFKFFWISLGFRTSNFWI